MQPNETPPSRKPRLLIFELWGLGDLAMASPFIKAACEKYDVTLLAKAYARDLHPLWPGAKLIIWNAPWTAFRKKYHIWRWDWRELIRVIRQLRGEKFDLAVSPRWDPRDHFLMVIAGVKQRFGFPRVGSRLFLTRYQNFQHGRHRYEDWRDLGKWLGLNLPARNDLKFVASPKEQKIIVHTGASQPTRVWPLENFRKIACRLRESGLQVTIACDRDQREWWLNHGEADVYTAGSVAELHELFRDGTAFIGNDSGPGHLAAVCGLPTFTIFGPSFPVQYAPLHPQAQWLEGKPCLYKPCKDYCRFEEPRCLNQNSVDECWSAVQSFLAKNGSPRQII
jgi:ADP-heptose:LPS heptosyltransferase